jgi:hypothetical protein
LTSTTVTTVAPTPTLVPDTAVTPSTAPVPSGGGGVTIDRTTSDDADDAAGVLWIVALVLGLLALVASPVVAVVWLKARRRARRRDDPDTTTAVSGAWAEAVDQLADRRLVWPASDTPREIAARVPQAAGPETAEPMRALAESYGAVRYGGKRLPDAVAQDAWRHVDALRRALDASGTFASRLRARLDPGTLRRQERVLVRPAASSPTAEPDELEGQEPPRPAG